MVRVVPLTAMPIARQATQAEAGEQLVAPAELVPGQVVAEASTPALRQGVFQVAAVLRRREREIWAVRLACVERLDGGKG